MALVPLATRNVLEPAYGSKFCYDCILCNRTMVSEDSIRRHVFTAHNMIDNVSLNKYYQIRDRRPKLVIPTNLFSSSKAVASPKKAASVKAISESKSGQVGKLAKTAKTVRSPANSSIVPPSKTASKRASVLKAIQQSTDHNSRDFRAEMPSKKAKIVEKRDVGCQASCCNCEILKERAKELQNLLASTFAMSDNVKTALLNM